MKSIQHLLGKTTKQMDSSQHDIDAAIERHANGEISDKQLAELKRQAYLRFFNSFGGQDEQRT